MSSPLRSRILLRRFDAGAKSRHQRQCNNQPAGPRRWISAPSCSSMKAPSSYGALMAKRPCPAATLWPLPRPQKRERRRRGREGLRQRQKPSALLLGRAARPVKPSSSAVAPTLCPAQSRPNSQHPCRHQIPRGCWASGAVATPGGAAHNSLIPMHVIINGAGFVRTCAG